MNRTIAAGVATFVGTFLFVIPEATELTDDHFMHVAWGRQLLYGRWFVRDMAALGMPLQSAISAASEWVVGYRLLSEAMVTALAFAIGAVLTFVLARRVSASIWIGASAATFQVALGPRTYGYPKIVLYAAAIFVFWAYIDRPSRRRFALIASIVATGFFLRHDHGLYLGLVAAGVLILRHGDEWRTAVQRLALFAVVCVLTIGPYLVYAQVVGGGVVTYVSELRTLAERERQQNRFEGWPRWPLSTLDDVIRWADARPGPATIGVRWKADVPQEARRAVAARYGLHVGTEGEIRSGRFLLTNVARENVLGLIGDPAVDDTAGVDRRTGLIPEPGLRVGALHLFPALDSSAASAAFLFYVFIALIPITLIGLARMRQPDTLTGRFDRLKIVAVVLIAIVTSIGFLREPLTIRISDAVVAPVVLAAWSVGRWFGGHTHARIRWRWRRGVPALIVLMALVPIIRSASVIGAVPQRIQRLTGLPTVWQQLAASPPFERWQGTSSAKYRTVRYVRNCTLPDDPLLVLWFAPDLYYYSDRPFAGRLGFYMEGYWSSDSSEGKNISMIERDRPTIAVMESDRDVTDLYTYPLLLRYLADSYHPVGTIPSDDGRSIEIFARSDRVPSATDAESGLPCYR